MYRIPKRSQGLYNCDNNWPLQQDSNYFSHIMFLLTIQIKDFAQHLQLMDYFYFEDAIK
jgi:hypothetical protein